MGCNLAEELPSSPYGYRFAESFQLCQEPMQGEMLDSDDKTDRSGAQRDCRWCADREIGVLRLFRRIGGERVCGYLGVGEGS